MPYIWKIFSAMVGFTGLRVNLRKILENDKALEGL